MSVRLCVIGDPIAQSLSPVIQTAMLGELGEQGSYTRVLVEREALPRFLSRVRDGEFTGFNATMPLKVDLVGLVDELDESARLSQSVNTVVRREDGALTGYSTDGAGFVEALGALGIASRGARVALLGAGGAARSLAAALAGAGAHSIAVCARRRSAAEGICAVIREATRGAVETAAYPFDPDGLAAACAGAGVLVNCTDLGMEGRGQFEDFGFLDALPGDAAVCDLVYHPAETRLLENARAQGRGTMNGLPLLVWQGVLALEKFLGGAQLPRARLARAAFNTVS